MLIEFNAPHALNFGEDFNYISTYINEEVDIPTVDDYRILIKGIKTGKEYLLYINSMNMFGKNRYRIEYIDGFKYDGNVIINDPGKGNKFYYDNIGTDPKHLEDMFSKWRKSDPMIHVGNLTHQFISSINGYTWSYRFNNKSF